MVVHTLLAVVQQISPSNRLQSSCTQNRYVKSTVFYQCFWQREEDYSLAVAVVVVCMNHSGLYFNLSTIVPLTRNSRFQIHRSLRWARERTMERIIYRQKSNHLLLLSLVHMSHHYQIDYTIQVLILLLWCANQNRSMQEWTKQILFRFLSLTLRLENCMHPLQLPIRSGPMLPPRESSNYKLRAKGNNKTVCSHGYHLCSKYFGCTYMLSKSLHGNRFTTS